MLKNIFFWGAKYKAGIIYDLITNNKIKEDTRNLFVKYLFDPGLKESKFKSKAEFSNKKENLEEFYKNSHYFVTCIGNELGMARYYISKELEKKKITPLNIISKSAYVDNEKLLGKGVQLFPNSVMHTNAKIGDYSILNTGAILEHDCLAGNGVHIMPGAVVGGNAIIGDYVSIGLNATVMPKVQIGEGAYIGAGAVVMNDVKKNEVVVGNPAKYLKKIEHMVNLDIFK
ncbi:NeuD/PglB/VioB family sugar acetyltransferase [Candidatus Pelagibacter sp.]|nr:NeuD/PglB/VioB family sugar acetyltransferase [Candidatus Pelagibacter sp.]